MDVLLFAFIAAALASWGDRPQLLAALLAARGNRPLWVAAGFLIAAVAVCAAGAALGAVLHGLVDARARVLLLAVACGFAGVAGMLNPDPPGLAARFRGGGFLTALLFGAAFASGSRVQFIVIGMAAWSGAPILTAAAGAAGLFLATMPATLLGKGFLELPLKPIRIALAGGFLLVAAATVVNAPPAV